MIILIFREKLKYPIFSSPQCIYRHFPERSKFLYIEPTLYRPLIVSSFVIPSIHFAVFEGLIVKLNTSEADYLFLLKFCCLSYLSFWPRVYRGERILINFITSWLKSRQLDFLFNQVNFLFSQPTFNLLLSFNCAHDITSFFKIN